MRFVVAVILASACSTPTSSHPPTEPDGGLDAGLADGSVPDGAPGSLVIATTDGNYTQWNFLGVKVGDTSYALPLTVSNTGETSSAAITIDVAGSGSSDFFVDVAMDGCLGVVLAPHGSCATYARFMPTKAGSRGAHLVANGGAPMELGGTGM